jgi:asparagine synthase (glutamine-hydrolysing)
MCSIEGFTGKHPFTISQFSLFNMDRGPDDYNYFYDEHVQIGHNLLAIQDNPSKITQPYVDDKGGVLSYNGELFNLDEFDTSFLSNLCRSDDISYLKENVNGMWGFSYYNPTEQTIILCRDHLGVKPLHYMIHDGNLFWSSTEKPLVAVSNFYNIPLSSDINSYEFFDGWSYPPYSHSYTNIYSLMPGEIKVWDIKNKRFDLNRNDTMWKSTWNLYPNLSWDKDEYRELAIKAIKETGYSKNKTALSLSGGLDSTIIASALKDQPDFFTTTVSFEKHMGTALDKPSRNKIRRLHREPILAKQTAKTFNLKCYETKYPQVKEATKKYFNSVVDAFGSYYFMFSRTGPRLASVLEAKKYGAKVFLTGDLGDELFTGYNRDSLWYKESYAHNINERLACWHVNYLLHGRPTPTGSPEETIRHFKLYHFPRFSLDGINNQLFFRMFMASHTYNTVMDRLCGSVGIESRTPFCHQELVRYVMKIPYGDKLLTKYSKFGGIRKTLLRDYLEDYIPEHITENLMKVGFSQPNQTAYNHKINLKTKKLEFETETDYLKNKLTFDL